MKRILLCATCVLALTAPAWARQEKAQPSNEAPAPVVKPAFDAEQNLKFCVIEELYPANKKLTLAMSPEENVNLGVTIPDAGFIKGASYDIVYRFDISKLQRTRAQAISETTLLLAFDRDPAFRAAFGSSQSFSVGGAGTLVDFALAPLSSALTSLESCVRQMRQAPAAPPRLEKAPQAQQAQAPAPTQPAPTAASATDDTLVWPEKLRGLLEEAGLKDIQPLSLASIPVAERPADYMWQAGTVRGGILAQQAPKEKNLDTLIAAHLNKLKADCSGSFSARLNRENQVTPHLKLRPALVICQMKGDKPVTLSVAILFLLTSEHLLTILTHESADTVTAIDIRDNLTKVLEKRAKAGQ